MTWTGQRLRDARVRAGIRSQAELAKRIGASTRAVAAWEREEAKPQAHWIAKLDDLLLPDTTDTPTEAPLDPRTIERALRGASVMQLFAALAERIADLEAGQRPNVPGDFPPERAKWRTEDAPPTTYEWTKTTREGGANDEAL